VKSVVAGWGHTAVVTSAGELLVCGRNLQGQLGLGDPANFPVNERNHPFQAHFVAVPLSQPSSSSSSSASSAASSASASHAPPFTVELGRVVGASPPAYTRCRAAQVACGGEHSACLTAGGEVYTFGAGGKGQLGHGPALANEHFPALLRTLKCTRREVHQVRSTSRRGVLAISLIKNGGLPLWLFFFFVFLN
jgi:alpha-tubulin suppressor-like RCC1 family protein